MAEAASFSSASGSRREPNSSLELVDTLDLIFQNLTDLNDFKSVCSVNSTWREAALRKWRNMATVQITLELIHKFYQEEHPIYLDDGEFEHTSREYMRFLLKECPFVRCRIPFYHMSFPPGPGRKQERFFWGKLGQHIKYLDLETSVFKRGQALEGLKWILLKRCPNLEELRLTPYLRKGEREPEAAAWQSDSDVGSLSSSFENLSLGEEEDALETIYSDDEEYLESEDDKDAEVKPEANSLLPKFASNLESLTISSADSESDQYEELFTKHEICRQFFNLLPKLKNLSLEGRKSTRKILRCLQDDMPDAGKIKLTRLNITGKSEILRALSDYVVASHPPLKTLKLQLLCGGMLSSLERILQKMEELENLEITIDYRFPGGSLSVAELFTLSNNMLRQCQLKKLTLKVNYHREKFGDIWINLSRLMRLMPQLRELRLEVNGPADFGKRTIRDLNHRWAYPHEWEVVPLHLPNLESFYFRGWFSDDVLVQFGYEIMPQLKLFGVCLDNERLPVVLESFKKLENVELLEGSSVDDEVVRKMNDLYPSVTIIK